MPISNNRRTGYVVSDNRVAPPEPGIPRFFEGDTKTCPHCTAQIILNPARVRERGYCRRCDSYICDSCAVLAKLSGGECKPFKQFIDEQDTLFHRQRII
jgi:hypothetical protein